MIPNDTQFPKFPEEDFPVTQRSFVLPVTGLILVPDPKKLHQNKSIKSLSKDYFFFCFHSMDQKFVMEFVIHHVI